MTSLKDVAANNDNGTATQVGGNHWMLVDAYYDDIDIAASIVNGTSTIRINTLTRFRSGKFSLRDSGNDHNYIFITSDLSGNRNITIPNISSDAKLVLDNVGNIFLDAQQIKRDGQGDFLSLYRTDNSGGNNVNILFEAEDSINSRTEYARIAMEIVDATDASEDGKLEFSTTSNGSSQEALIINSNGFIDILRGGLTITLDGNGNGIDLYRTDSAVFDNLSINFYLQDSGSAKQQYCAITGEINVNTAGAEDGVLIFRNTKAGTLRNCATLYMDGYWDLFNYSSTTLDYVGIGFDLNNSSNTRTAYGEIKGEIRTNTAGSEDGRIVMTTRRAGSNIRTHEFRNDGNITCSRNGSTTQFVPRIIDCSGVVVDVLNTGAETTAASIVIPASTMGTNGSVNWRIMGVLKQNSVTNVNYHFRLKLNGTTVWSDNLGPALVQSATNAPWCLDIDFANMNSSSSNRLYVLASLNDLTTPSTGEGDVTDDEQHGFGFGKSFIQSVSTTSDVTMLLSIDMDQTQAASGWEMQYYRAVLYPQ